MLVRERRGSLTSGERENQWMNRYLNSSKKLLFCLSFSLSLSFTSRLSYFIFYYFDSFILFHSWFFSTEKDTAVATAAADTFSQSVNHSLLRLQTILPATLNFYSSSCSSSPFHPSIERKRENCYLTSSFLLFSTRRNVSGLFKESTSYFLAHSFRV